MDEGQVPQEQPAWQFSAEEQAASSAPAEQPPPQEAVTWTASEYVAHHKNPGWFTAYALGLVVLAAVIYLFTRDTVSTIMVFVLGVAFGVFAARQPRVLEYVVDGNGVHIGPRTYLYSVFKSFSVVEEGLMRSISLLPMQRFMPPISIYYDPADEGKIITTLSSHLPVEDRSHDMVERLMRRLRF